MKTTAFAIALLMSGAAIAGPGHTDADAAADLSADASVSADASTDTAIEATTTSDAIVADTSFDSTATHATASNAIPASGQLVQPGNENPERDARGIAVISDTAMVPAGFNGSLATGVGGPELDPATGETVAADSYPACSRTVTDNCLQTYERGRAD